MLRIKSKKKPSTKSTRAARKGGPYDLRHDFRRGDRIRICDCPEAYKDPGYKDDPDMRTGELFRFCVGRKFTIRGFGRYGHIELRVDDDPEVTRKFGLNSIWVEPQFVELISKTRRRVDRPDNGLGWREDFLEAEKEFTDKNQKSVGETKRVRRKRGAIRS
jgi:hypothetical protein